MSFLKNRVERLKQIEGRESASAAIWGRDTFVRSAGAGLPKVKEAELPPSDDWKGTFEPQRRDCGNPECSMAWAKPWKSRRRPIFEDQWGCGAKCLQTLIRSAVRREVGEGVNSFAAAVPHRHRVPLGLVMLAQGWITHPQLRKALDEQRAAGGGKIGDWLQQGCGLSPETVTRGLSVQWSCPVLGIEGFAPKAMALVMPRVLIEEYAMLPLRLPRSRALHVAFEDRLDASASFSLQQMTGLKVESGLLPAAEFAAARERLLECSFVPAVREQMRDSEQMTTRIGELLEERQPVAARLVRVHEHFWLRTWLEMGAQGGAGTVPTSTEDVFDTLFTVGLNA